MGASYRRRRLLTFLHPFDDPLGDGYQILQSLIAVGTGGVWGKGLMNGVQKLFYLPEPHTDFIYAVISEELGLVGATLVLLCFVGSMRGLNRVNDDHVGTARRDRGWRHRRSSVSRYRRRAGVAGAPSGRARVVRRNSEGHRIARDSAGRIRTRPDSQRRPQGEI